MLTADDIGKRVRDDKGRVGILKSIYGNKGKPLALVKVIGRDETSLYLVRSAAGNLPHDYARKAWT